MLQRSLTRILLVEDDELCRASVSRTIERWGGVELRAVGTEAEARAELDGWKPDVLVLDVRLGRDSGLEVAEHAATMSPAPVIVAMSGAADSSEAFRLAQLGARAYLEKPAHPGALRAAVQDALETPPDLGPLLRASVGTRPLREVVTSARMVMTRQALAMAEGNQSGAARFLDVSRQNVQATLRRGDPSDEPAE